MTAQSPEFQIKHLLSHVRTRSARCVRVEWACSVSECCTTEPQLYNTRLPNTPMEKGFLAVLALVFIGTLRRLQLYVA